MSRRRKRKSKDSEYLNPEFAEVQDALETTADQDMIDKYGMISCRKCLDGFGVPDEDCWNCGARLKLRGKMAINLPPEAKGTKASNTNPHGFGGTMPYQGGGGGWESHMHKGDKIIFEAEGKQLYAGNGRGVNEYSGAWDLIIDLAHNLRNLTPSSFIERGSTKKYEELTKHTYGTKPYPSEVLSLNWPDGSSAPASLDFWLQLWSMLPAKTVMMCMGGHGRTGTCMAALMIAAGIDYYTAVNTVRKEHCMKAIETLVQEIYLHKLYMSYLERLQTEIEDPKELDDIGTELAFAKAHVPNQQSSFGTDPKEGVKSTLKSGTNTNSPAALVGGVGGLIGEHETYRIMNGLHYVKECTVKFCRQSITVAGCNDPAHMGWVPLDPVILGH